MATVEVDTMLGKVKCNERDYKNAREAFDMCWEMKRDRYSEKELQGYFDNFLYGYLVAMKVSRSSYQNC